MGFRASWIAAEGMSEDALLRHLRWKRTGRTEDEHHDPGMVVLRRQGWTILFGDGSEHFMEIEAADAAACSASHRILFLSLSDTVMQSELRCFERGIEVWSVVKEAGAPRRPEVTGSAPAELAAILARLEAEQAGAVDVDYWYDAPADLGEVLTGFRHDAPRADAGFHDVVRA
jgi:hypothetical protein